LKKSLAKIFAREKRRFLKKAWQKLSQKKGWQKTL
jgi:hypothetical protein